MKNDVIRLGIGLPAYGGKIDMNASRMWMSMGFALESASNRFQLVGHSLVDVCGVEVARNRLVEEAIAADADWLLMIDADSWVDDAFSILQGVSSAARSGAVAYAIPTPRRGGADTHLMIYRDVGGVRQALTANELAAAKIAHGDTPGTALVPVDSAATAMMAFDVRFVREKLAPPWFRFEWKYGTTTFVSEDLAFCRRLTEAGGRIVADASIVAHHRQRPEVL